MNDSLPGLAGKKYSVIVSDPPWRFMKYSEIDQSRSAENHYSVMSIDDIRRLPVTAHAEKDCVLLMWVTDPMLEQAFTVINAWGFTYKTVGFVWAKENRCSPGWFTGMGYWTRANPELCLLATRGSPKRKARDVSRLLVAPRREHSRKPDEVITRIERLLDGPYLELFARQQRSGWDCWGNEVSKFNPLAADLLPL